MVSPLCGYRRFSDAFSEMYMNKVNLMTEVAHFDFTSYDIIDGPSYEQLCAALVRVGNDVADQVSFTFASPSQDRTLSFGAEVYGLERVWQSGRCFKLTLAFPVFGNGVARLNGEPLRSGAKIILQYVTQPVNGIFLDTVPPANRDLLARDGHVFLGNRDLGSIPPLA